MRSESKNASQLRKDILDSVYHVFGYHKKCSDFCKKGPNNNLKKDCDKNNGVDEMDTDEDSFDCIWKAKWILEITIIRRIRKVKICWKK